MFHKIRLSFNQVQTVASPPHRLAKRDTKNTRSISAAVAVALENCHTYLRNYDIIMMTLARYRPLN